MMQDSLGETLRMLRARADLGVIEASEQIGIARQTLRRLESGVGHPYYPTLEKIARFYNVPIRSLVALIDEESADEEELTLPKVPAPLLN